jgi:hypothetical protein
MSLLFHRTLPDEGRVTVARIRISVDFPAPFGPQQTQHARPESQIDIAQCLHRAAISLAQFLYGKLHAVLLTKRNVLVC